MKVATLSFVLAATVAAQVAPGQPGLLSEGETRKLVQDVVSLMTQTASAIPDVRVASPGVIAEIHHTAAALDEDPKSGPYSLEFQRELRFFLLIAEAAPKPIPLPGEAAQALAGLGDAQMRFDAHLNALIAREHFLLHDPDPDGVAHYAEQNARVLPPGAAPRVVFLGDSITERWPLNEYFTGRDFLNRGISGQISSQMLGRFQEDVLNLRPRAVVIVAGANDLGRETPLNIIESNLIMMAELARAAQVRVIIGSVLPVGSKYGASSTHTIQLLNDWITNYCAKSGCTYADFYSKLRDPSGFMQPDVSDDGTHPNGKGYRLIAPMAIEAIDHALGQSTTPVEPRRRIIRHIF